MKRILLICSAGMSTSLLVNKMVKEANARGIEAFIEANGFSDVKQFDGKFDCCLVGPQIRYALAKIDSDLPSMPCEIIDMKIYGMADGAAALDQALRLIGDK